ncbi:MAG TPA: DUF424 family protein [Nitrososphaeraceae archaeon]|nr:DUF424 family protein [Nitrososphaeraceae archaeon]
MIDTNTDKKLSPDASSDSNLKFYVRKMHYQGSLMINICDEELIGTNIASESLDINITNDFFNELTSEKEICNLLKRCSIANLIGRRVVEKTLNLGLAKRESIRIVSDIPFLMIFKFCKNY